MYLSIKVIWLAANPSSLSSCCCRTAVQGKRTRRKANLAPAIVLRYCDLWLRRRLSEKSSATSKPKRMPSASSRKASNPFPSPFSRALILDFSFPDLNCICLSKSAADIAKNHQVRKQYTIQLGENELVLKVFPFTLLIFLKSFGCVSRVDFDAHILQELELLNENANVYKLIGSVLVKQDLAETNANVRKRIEYISAELWVPLALL